MLIPSSKKRRNIGKRGLALLGLLGAIALGQWTEAQARSPANAEKELPTDDSLRKDSYRVYTILTAGRFADATERQLFEDYYQKYYLPQWTLKSNLDRLHKLRRQLCSSHLGRRCQGGSNVHDHLCSLVLDYMKELASGPYHPAVQVNAMLMIGQLNHEEYPSGTPLPQALHALLAAVDDGNASDAVRVAALVGVQRHVAAGITTPDTLENVRSILLKVATVEIPFGRVKDGREWMRAQALEALADLGSVGENHAVFTAMTATLNDTTLLLSTRGIAAESLGQLNYTNASGIDPLESAAAVANFLRDACAEETRLANEKADSVLGHGHSSYHYLLERRMRQRLSSALTALVGTGEDRTGIAGLTQDIKQQARIAELRKSIDSLCAFLDDKKHNENNVQASVNQLRSNLDVWVKKAGQTQIAEEQPPERDIQSHVSANTATSYSANN